MPPGIVKKKKKFTDKISLSVTSLQNDYLNIDRGSGSGRNN